MSSPIGAQPVGDYLFADEEFERSHPISTENLVTQDETNEPDISGLLPFDDDDIEQATEEEIHSTEVFHPNSELEYSVPRLADLNRDSGQYGSSARLSPADDDLRPSTVVVSQIETPNSELNSLRPLPVKKRRHDGESRKKGVQKQKKRRREYIDEGEAITRVQDFLSRMSEAATLDEEALRKNEPAINKLKMLEEVVSEVQKPKWVQWYLQEGLCHILDRWLSPLPNGSLPNITLRRKLFDMIRKLPLTIDYLTDTTLGVKLVSFWKARDETDDNRYIIKEIITALVHPLLSYSRQPSKPITPVASIPPQTSSTFLSKRGSSLRASIPRTVPRSFAVAPKSLSVTTSTGREPEILSIGFKLQRHETHKNWTRKR